MTNLRLDPSQILALHALLEERHVTRAAKRLGISQSSMSHRLRALRESLGDPLLIREGRSLVLSERAAALQAPLTDALTRLQDVLGESAPFDPATVSTAMNVALPDLLAPLLPEFLAQLNRDAPGLQLRIVGLSGDLSTSLRDGRAHLAIAPAHFAAPNTRSRSLGNLRFAVVGRRGHPALEARLTQGRWLAYPHIVVSIDNPAANVIDEALAKRGKTRTVGLVVPNFASALLAVGNSDLLMNAPMPLVEQIVERIGLQTRPAPLPLPEMRLALLWHECHHVTPVHRWFRDRLFGFVRPRLKARRG